MPKGNVPPPRRVYPQHRAPTDSRAGKSILLSSIPGGTVVGADGNVSTPVIDVESNSDVCDGLPSNTKEREEHEVRQRLEKLTVQEEERDELLKETVEKEKDGIGLQTRKRTSSLRVYSRVWIVQAYRVDPGVGGKLLKELIYCVYCILGGIKAQYVHNSFTLTPKSISLLGCRGGSVVAVC